jgi:hypothetical protein
MTWNEHDFIERLEPDLRRPHGAPREACPDAAVLSALVDDPQQLAATPQIRGHIEHCSECTDLYNRLLRFAQAEAPLHAPEWHNAEKRLDLWMESFLRTSTSGSPSPRVEIERPAASRQHRWGWLHVSLGQWALGTALGLAGVLAVAVLLNQGRESTGPPEPGRRPATFGTPVAAPAGGLMPAPVSDAGRLPTPTFTEGDSADDVQKRMGKPKQVIPDPNDRSVETWVYQTAHGAEYLTFRSHKLVTVVVR